MHHIIENLEIPNGSLEAIIADSTDPVILVSLVPLPLLVIFIQKISLKLNFSDLNITILALSTTSVLTKRYSFLNSDINLAKKFIHTLI